MVAPGRLGSKRAPVLCLPHPEQSAHGIAASDEPVSTIRLKVLWSAPRQTLAAKYPSVFRLPSSRQPSDTAVSRRPTRSGPCPCGWKLRRVNEWFVLTAPTNEAEGLMLVIIIGFDELETARHRHSATTRVAFQRLLWHAVPKKTCEAIISVRPGSLVIDLVVLVGFHCILGCHQSLGEEVLAQRGGRNRRSPNLKFSLVSHAVSKV